MHKLILIGAGGHAKSCLDLIESIKKYKILGFIDNKKKETFEKYKVLGCDSFLKNIRDKDKTNIAITIGQIKDYKKRKNIFLKVKNMGFKFPVIISKYAVVSKKAKIDKGTMIFSNALINRGASIGSNTIINSYALIEHDVSIGSNTHISTRATINGNVLIGSNTFIGSGAIIKEGVSIGKNCIIGMGSVIKKNIKNNSIIK
mgnify:CR=1 FL=1|tara:strand:+ start:2923 stop:3528 length:606 start_codon:yes stop_codon:yes gene_type:complete